MFGRDDGQLLWKHFVEALHKTIALCVKRSGMCLVRVLLLLLFPVSANRLSQVLTVLQGLNSYRCDQRLGYHVCLNSERQPFRHCSIIVTPLVYPPVFASDTNVITSINHKWGNISNCFQLSNENKWRLSGRSPLKKKLKEKEHVKLSGEDPPPHTHTHTQQGDHILRNSYT